MSLFGHLIGPVRMIGAAAAGILGGLLKTGQTTQYAGELDDGFYEDGLDTSYEVLTTGQYAGTTNVTVAARTDVKSNNCVRDLVTGLMWSRYVSASVGPAADGRMAWTGAADDIFAYCLAANVAGLAGHSDWQVPNVVQLFSLAVREGANAVPDPVAFPTWPPDWVWTSTDVCQLANTKFRQHFLRGGTGEQGEAATNYCALVRVE